VASEVDVPLIAFVLIFISLNVIIVYYKKGVVAAVPRLDFKSASVKSAWILVIVGCVELILEALIIQINVLELDLLTIISVPELRAVGVLVFIIWNPFQHTIAFRCLYPCTPINIICKIITSPRELITSKAIST
jgi:hypothetical protein